MSQAFVRESDEQWLHEVPPTMNALLILPGPRKQWHRVYEQSVSSSS
jgi:hypothetical protein